MEIINMNSNGFRSVLILSLCGWGLWKMTSGLFGPAVTPGEVTMLTADNFPSVRKEAGTLVALYTKPG